MAIGRGAAADVGRIDQERQDSCFTIPEHVRSNHGLDGAVLLDIVHGQMFRLNFVGSRILELLKQGLAAPAIVEQLAGEFGIDRGLADADVHEFLETLAKHNLVSARAR